MLSRRVQTSLSVVSGRRLCFAFRPAGRATSSGLAREIGCPGGAPGLPMLSNTGRACWGLPFRGDLLLTINQPPLNLLGFGRDATKRTSKIKGRELAEAVSRRRFQ